MWGPRPTDEVRWRGHNPWDLAENLRPLQLALRTGNGESGPLRRGRKTQDPLEAFVYRHSVSLHERFDELGISHTWDDYGPGTHSWPYWARGLRQTLDEQMAAVRRRRRRRRG